MCQGMETHFGSSTFIHFFGTFLLRGPLSMFFHCFSELQLYFSSLFYSCFFFLNHVALCGSFVFGSVSLLFKFYAFPQLCPYVVHLYICMHVLHIIFAWFFWISFADMFQGKH